MKSGKERVTMGTYILVLCLFLKLSIVFSEPTISCPGIKSPGTTFPRGDVILEFGNPLHLYCMLNPEHDYYKNQGYNSSHLVFDRGMDRVDPEYVSIVNSTTIFLNITEPALSESMYYCRLLYNSGEITVCLNHVAVGTEPQEVEKFECLSLNWNNLTCSWKPPHNYVKTYSELSFRLPRRGRMQSFPCPYEFMTMDSETGEHFCFWSLFTDPPYRQSYDKYYFNLTTYNQFGSRTHQMIFNHYAYLKPNSPTNLTADHKTPHSCQLHWSLPDPMQNFPSGLNHRILYRSDIKENWFEVDVSDLPTEPKSEQKDYSFNLTNLQYAYRHYNVRVAIRPEKARDEKFWSDYAVTTFRTSAKPPERPPLIDIGGFEVFVNLNYRNVTIYWEQLKDYEENGDNFTYKVDLLSDNIKKIQLKTHRGYIIFNFLPWKALEFAVTSTNSEGESPTASRIVIPSQNELNLKYEPSNFIKIDLGNGTYELSWKAPKGNSSLLESYTIFWCDNPRDRPFQCEGRLSWKRIPPNITTKNLTMTDNKIYQFAISANAYGSSSGMIWASCTVVPNKAVGKLKDIWVHEIDATSIKIKWKLDCPDNSGVITGYKISRCPIFGLQNTTCKEPVITQLVKNNANFGVLTGLKPYTTYAIQVAIVAQHEVGPRSDPILTTTKASAPDPPQNISVWDVSSTSMRVSWQPPLITNGVLMYYTISYKTNDSACKDLTREKDSREAHLKDLLSYTDYTITVEACTVECSNSSEKIHIRTDIGAPGNISRLAVRNIRGEHRVDWDPPVFTGGMVDFYEVKRIVIKEGKNESETFNTTKTHLSFKGIICDEDIVSYQYFVRAVNLKSVGDHLVEYRGNWSSLAENTCSRSVQSDTTLKLIVIFITIIALIVIAYFANKLRTKVGKMQNIKPIMPDGLFPEFEKENKSTGKWDSSPKHIKDNNVAYPSPPADEQSLLESPSIPPASPEDPSTVMTNLGGSSHHANSPTWQDNRYPPFENTWTTDDSDGDIPAPPVGNPYVSFSTQPSSSTVPGGYVQAAIVPTSSKGESQTALPPTYVLTSPAITSNLIEPSQAALNTLPSNYVRTAPDVPVALTPKVAVVSPYVSFDDKRFSAATNTPQPDVDKKNSNSGYVTHNDSMFNKPKMDLLASDHHSPSKRISAPPGYNNSKESTDNNKRTSLSNYTTLGMDSPNPACSPEYCRYGWNSPESVGVDHQTPDSEKLDPLNIANLEKEKYEMPLEDLLSEDDVSSSKQPTASHYLPLSLHSLKS